MGTCGMRSKSQVTVPRVAKGNPTSVAALRSRLLELKQADKVPILSLEKNRLHIRRLLGQETMAESWEGMQVVKD